MKLQQISRRLNFSPIPIRSMKTVRAAGRFTQIAPGAVLDGAVRGRRGGSARAADGQGLHEECSRALRRRWTEPARLPGHRAHAADDEPARARACARCLMKAFNARQIQNLREIAVNGGERTGRRIRFARACRPHRRTSRCRCRSRSSAGFLDVPLEEAAQLSRTTSQRSRPRSMPHRSNGERLKAANELYPRASGVFRGLVERRRSKPGSDLISSLTTLEDEGESLTDEEIVSQRDPARSRPATRPPSSMIGSAADLAAPASAQLAKLDGRSFADAQGGGGMHALRRFGADGSRAR